MAAGKSLVMVDFWSCAGPDGKPVGHGCKVGNEYYEYVNVTVENRFVENDEYYRLLSESEYCIIPYDADFYRNRTSGVIQKCLFCDCIPIAPRSILEF